MLKVAVISGSIYFYREITKFISIVSAAVINHFIKNKEASLIQQSHSVTFRFSRLKTNPFVSLALTLRLGFSRQ